VRPDDTFVPVPTIDALLLEHTLRRRVFNLLLRRAKITPAVVDAMQSWHHSGFSAHTRVRVTPDEPQAAERVLRARLVGVDEGTLWRWEQGMRTPTGGSLSLPTRSSASSSSASPRNGDEPSSRIQATIRCAARAAATSVGEDRPGGSAR